MKSLAIKGKMARFRKVSGYFVLDQLKNVQALPCSVPACVEQVGHYANPAGIRPGRSKIDKFPAYYNELD